MGERMGEKRIDGEWDRARGIARQKEIEWDSAGRWKVEISFSFTIH